MKTLSTSLSSEAQADPKMKYCPPITCLSPLLRAPVLKLLIKYFLNELQLCFILTYPEILPCSVVKNPSFT